MRFCKSFGLLILGLLACAGCENQPNSDLVSTEADRAADPTHAAASARTMTDANSMASNSSASDLLEQPMDYGDWLVPPTEVDQRLMDVYPTLVRSSIAGDANGLANLALVSQQMAGGLAQQGKLEEAYGFVAQAGRALRAGLAGGASGIPQSMIGQMFFNEACALSKTNQPTAAVAALEEAIAGGFTDIDLIASEDDLAEARNSEGFAERLVGWRSVAAEKVRALAVSDLAAGESFPFALMATDIVGNEQSLDAQKGKVVIVDVWGTWCPPCRAEIPSFVRLQSAYGEQGFQMLGLNYERQASEEANLKAVVDFVAKYAMNYPCILGDEKTRELIPDFRGYPTTLFIDKAGNVRMKAVGLHDYAYLAAVVEQLLAEAE